MSPGFLTVARSQSNFKFIELFPLGFRSFFIAYREKGSQTLAPGHPLRFIHGDIVPIAPRRPGLCPSSASSSPPHSGDSHDSGRKGNGRRARFPALDADRLIEQLKNGSAV